MKKKPVGLLTSLLERSTARSTERPSPFALQFMTGPVLKAKRPKTPTVCEQCGATKPGKEFIHKPYDVCQVCIAKTAVEHIRRKKREQQKASRSN